MIETVVKTVYKSSLVGRSYQTRRAAIQAEARALIKARYPTEKNEYEQGILCSRGFHWTEMPRSDVLFRRVCRLIKAKTTT